MGKEEEEGEGGRLTRKEKQRDTGDEGREEASALLTLHTFPVRTEGEKNKK